MRSDILRDLAQRIRAIETAAGTAGPSAGLRLPLLTPLLGEEAALAGMLVELLAEAEGGGAWTLALLLARQSCVAGKALVLVDPRGWFYPPAAARLGFDLDQLLVVQPESHREAQAALEQTLRCPAVGAVVAWCERLRPAEARRLQLAVEAGGGLGFLLRPGGLQSSEAALRLRVLPVAGTQRARRVRLEVVRWRRGREGQALVVEIDDETGDVHLSAELPPAKTGTH